MSSERISCEKGQPSYISHLLTTAHIPHLRGIYLIKFPIVSTYLHYVLSQSTLLANQFTFFYNIKSLSLKLPLIAFIPIPTSIVVSISNIWRSN